MNLINDLKWLLLMHPHLAWGLAGLALFVVMLGLYWLVELTSLHSGRSRGSKAQAQAKAPEYRQVQLHIVKADF